MTPLLIPGGIAYKWAFDLHLCHATPHCDRVIGFDVYHRWKITNYDDQWIDELALKAEWMYADPDEEDEENVFTPLFEIKCGQREVYTQSPEQRRAEGLNDFTAGIMASWNQQRRLNPRIIDTVRFKTRNARYGSRAFEYRARGSGGNWYWEIFQFPQAEQAHVLNWLRRVIGQVGQPKAQARMGKSEWDNAFVETIWNARRSLTRRDLKRYTLQCIRHHLREERKLHGDAHVLACFQRKNEQHAH